MRSGGFIIGAGSAALLAVAMAAGMQGCDGQSAENVSKGLADNLTNTMEFKNGQKVEGQPPQANTGSSKYPQSSLEQKTDKLGSGEGFNIKLKTDYKSSGSALLLAPGLKAKVPAAVSSKVKAVVYVWNAEEMFDNYILIDASINPDGTVDLPGKMKDDISWLKQNDQRFRVFIALGIEAGGEVFVGNYVEWEPTIYYAYCWIAGTDSNCPGAYACQMEDSSFCWLGYFDQVYMCEACPQTEGEFEVVCAEAVRQLVQACLGGGDSINCESYGPLGYCYDVKGCCYTRRGQCWYEADDGTRFYCAEGSCDAAAQDAYDHCTYGG